MKENKPETCYYYLISSYKNQPVGGNCITTQIISSSPFYSTEEEAIKYWGQEPNVITPVLKGTGICTRLICGRQGKSE